jgi:hypothetical protein
MGQLGSLAGKRPEVQVNPKAMKVPGASLYPGDALSHYARWPPPKVIICDGPYGLRSFPGDPPDVSSLCEFYRPHVEAWGHQADPSTTLWFWCSELGWATVHPLLEAHGWQYVRACVWDKGAAHIAGNTNSQRLRQLPTVTELCVQYVRKVLLPIGGTGEHVPIKQWLRGEWQRSGLPLSLTNEVAGVKNAATRKWFTQCHLWYSPGGDFLARLAAYANEHGDPTGAPYFTVDGGRSISAEAWDRLRPTFHCPPDVHNVWRHGAVRGQERIKLRGKTVHMNQKPLALVRQTIAWSTDAGDCVWEPFAGTATALVASVLDERQGYGAEINPEFFAVAIERLRGAANG